MGAINNNLLAPTRSTDTNAHKFCTQHHWNVIAGERNTVVFVFRSHQQHRNENGTCKVNATVRSPTAALMYRRQLNHPMPLNRHSQFQLTHAYTRSDKRISAQFEENILNIVTIQWQTSVIDQPNITKQ